jgi:hypothetical protein
MREAHIISYVECDLPSVALPAYRRMRATRRVRRFTFRSLFTF